MTILYSSWITNYSLPCHCD